MKLTHLETKPTLHPTAYIAPGAVVVGDVLIGEASSVWFGCVLRGDVHRLEIGARVNLQDGTICHGQLGQFGLIVEDEVSVGHSVVLHGCHIGRQALIGIRATVLNGAEIGEQAIVAAGSVVTEGTRIPPRTLWAGIPAKQKRELGQKDLALLDTTWRHYIDYAAEMRLLGICGRPPENPLGGAF